MYQRVVESLAHHARLIQRGLVRRFGIDSRALAGLRISLALLLLADLSTRSFDLVAFYTDRGVLPRATLSQAFPGFSTVSIHALSGEAWFQFALFLLAAVVALLLLVGYHTRLATVASLVLLVSLHARNPLLLNAGDSLLRRLLFWGVFLPLGGRWSIDARRRVRRRNDAYSDEPTYGRVATLATAALLIQVVIVYSTNAGFKLQGELWQSGDAIRYVFGLDHLTVLAGDALAQYPAVLVAVDRIWLVLIAASLLLVVLTGRLRTAFVVAFAAAHLGMALTLRLGLFPLVSIAALLPFLPRSVWDRVERLLSRSIGGTFERLGDWLDRGLPRTSGPRFRRATPRWHDRFTPALVGGFLALVLVWNAAAFGLVGLPDEVTESVDPEEHRWDMFAPEPRTIDGWYVVPGQLESGEEIDAFHGGAMTWNRPDELSSTFPSHRWFVYLLDLRQRRYATLRDDFGAYLCDRWNRSHEDDLVALTVYFVEEPVRLDGAGSTNRVELADYRCSSASRS